MKSIPYWEDTCKPVNGIPTLPKRGGILIIGSGFAGLSTAYHLAQTNEFDQIQVVDAGTENSAYGRNAGHILYGVGESYKALTSIRGRDEAKALLEFSYESCSRIAGFIKTQNIQCDYTQGDYFSIATTPAEQDEQRATVNMLAEDFQHQTAVLSENGAEGTTLHCSMSAQAHPVKFRNGLLKEVLDQGTDYYTYKVRDVSESGQGLVRVIYEDDSITYHDSVVIAANVYSPWVESSLNNKIEPFRGQILVSAPMNTPCNRVAFSADHGYIYGQTLPDSRVLIGGWRNNSSADSHTHQLGTVDDINVGLKDFVKNVLQLGDLEWEYCWSGIMGASHNGLPLVGPTSSGLIYTCSGFTGYGFGWAFGCGKLLADIMVGNDIPDIAYKFRP